MKLHWNRYGKQRVRVLRVVRNGKQHSVKEITASVLMSGDFDASYFSEDNSPIVATDTVKNTVHALAQDFDGAHGEDFALLLGNHFLSRYAQVEKVEIDLSERIWDRLSTEAGPHPHTFVAAGRATPLVSLVAEKGAPVSLISGIENLLVMKTTESAFKGYPRCEHTTLPETDDRIMATSVLAKWTWQEAIPRDWSALNARILEALLRVYANAFSPSVQRTLFQMGEAALESVREISSMELRLPNKHYLPINLEPFERANDGSVFLPTDEPHGEIEAIIRR